MPHKHKRKRGDDSSAFNLEPLSHAKSLPVLESRGAPIEKSIKSNKRRNPNGTAKQDLQRKVDDTPKSFARLMAFQKTGKRIPSGLDEGRATKRMRKSTQNAVGSQTGTSMNGHDGESTPPPNSQLTDAETKSRTPRIQPGERLAEFSVRVNQSIPLHGGFNGHSTSSTKPGNIPGFKAPVTKHTKKLMRMQKEWRETEARLQAKREEAEDEANLDDTREEDKLLWSAVRGAQGMRKGKKRKNLADGEDVDPWKVLERKRREAGAEQKGILDVVQAPPVLKRVKNIFRQNDLGGLKPKETPGFVANRRKTIPT